MKSSFKTVVLSLPMSVLFFLIVVFISSCGAKTYPLAVSFLIDSSGPGTHPHVVTNGTIPAGTLVVLECGSPNCNSKTGSGSGSSKILFRGTLTQDIPANTEIVLRMVSQAK